MYTHKKFIRLLDSRWKDEFLELKSGVIDGISSTSNAFSSIAENAKLILIGR